MNDDYMWEDMDDFDMTKIKYNLKAGDLKYWESMREMLGEQIMMEITKGIDCCPEAYDDACGCDTCHDAGCR